MPSMHRSFTIPTSSADNSTVNISLYEPSLTGDNLGHKTWAAAYLLSKRLCRLKDYIPCLARPQQEHSLPRVLELGAGTGLVGLSFAATFRSVVHLTDLDEIVPNLATNIEANKTSLIDAGSMATAYVLNWATLPERVGKDQGYDVIIAADPLYSPEHPQLLVDAIVSQLSPSEDARVIVELPLREAYLGEVRCLWDGMKEKGFELCDEGEEVGYDDWDEGTSEVRCWWGVWRWQQTSERVLLGKPAKEARQ